MEGGSESARNTATPKIAFEGEAAAVTGLVVATLVDVWPSPWQATAVYCDGTSPALWLASKGAGLRAAAHERVPSAPRQEPSPFQQLGML